MPAIYCADIYCDSCANAIRERILAECSDEEKEKFDDETKYDSDEFPKYMSDDEESDSPQHCACGDECLECVYLPSGDKIGALLSRSLTTDGVSYVTEAVADGGEVAEFWEKEFESDGYDFDLIEIAKKSSGWNYFWRGGVRHGL